MQGSTNRRIVVPTFRAKSKAISQKSTKAKRAGSMAQVVEDLPTKQVALTSIPSIRWKRSNSIYIIVRYLFFLKVITLYSIIYILYIIMFHSKIFFLFEFLSEFFISIY
jgi:hypothetical protein